MILLMRNIDNSLYFIFNGEYVQYTLKTTILIFIVFLIFDLPYFYGIFGYKVAFMCDYVMAVFSLLFIGLSVSTYIVIDKISNLRLRAMDIHLLNCEKYRLYGVIFVFDLAYLGRVICCATIFKTAYEQKYSEFEFRVVTLSTALFLDVLPVLFVMLIHHFSFKDKR